MSGETCPRCGRPMEPGASRCPACGATLQATPELRFCPVCGARAEREHRFCGRCGRALAGAAGTAEPTSPPVLTRVPAAAAAARPERLEPTPLASPRRPLRIVPLRHDRQPAPPVAIGPAGLVCGRSRGQLVFEADATVSPEHARFGWRGDELRVEDLGSLNGTFLRLRTPRPLAPGDEIRLGRQLLKLEAMPVPVGGTGARPWGSPDPGYRARLVQQLDAGGTGEVFPLLAGENTIGREVARVSFPGDRFVSARHARIDVGPAGLILSDVGSSNGTFVRISVAEPLQAGDQVLIGMQLLRVE